MMKLNKYLAGLALGCALNSTINKEDAMKFAKSSGKSFEDKIIELESVKKSCDPADKKYFQEAIDYCNKNFLGRHKWKFTIGASILLLAVVLSGVLIYRKKKSKKISGASMKNNANAGRIARRAR